MMIWILRDEEIQSVIGLDGPERYRYCIKKIADSEMLWSLKDDKGWALFGDDAGHQLFPIWPHEKYASLCVDSDWAGYRPNPIALDSWLKRWLPGLKDENKLLAVFPTPQGRGIAVEPARLEMDLREELKWYE